MSTLITFFSAEGTTAEVAREYAERTGADVFEICPEKPYSSADIKYMNPMARCNREQMGKKDVPINGTVENFEQYDTVYIGFPIWYAQAPRVIYTFCKGYDWTGKNIHLFATSGGSGMGKTAEFLAPYVKGGNIVEAKLVKSASEI